MCSAICRVDRRLSAIATILPGRISSAHARSLNTPGMRLHHGHVPGPSDGAIAMPFAPGSLQSTLARARCQLKWPVGTGSTKALERPQKPTVIDDWDPRRLDSTLKRRRIGASGHLRPGFLSARLTHARNCLKPSIQLASTPLCLSFLPFPRKYLPEYLLEYLLKHLLKHLSSHLPGRYAIQVTTPWTRIANH